MGRNDVMALNLHFCKDGKVFLNDIEYYIERWFIDEDDDMVIYGHQVYTWSRFSITEPEKLAKIKDEYIKEREVRRWPRFWIKEKERFVPAWEDFEMKHYPTKIITSTSWSIIDEREKEY